jgi:tripartite-type tricarboxylate transporter receptor subunit TctC
MPAKRSPDAGATDTEIKIGRSSSKTACIKPRFPIQFFVRAAVATMSRLHRIACLKWIGRREAVIQRSTDHEPAARFESRLAPTGIALVNFTTFKLCAQGLVLAVIAVHAGPAAMAQDYPSRPITIKVAFPAGGPADVSVRAANVILQRNLGQPVVAENVPGATGSISAMAVLKATADGYTLLGTTGSDFVTAPFTIAAAKYQPDSFRLLGVLGISDFVLVSSVAHSFGNIDDLIDYAKKPANKELTLGHWGKGSTAHIVGADFQVRAGTTFLEVPYRGAAPALSDMTGQHLDLTFAPLGGSTLELIQSGKIKAIAVTGEKRNPALPDVPTINESTRIKNFEYSIWSGLFAPPNTPEPVAARLTEALNEWVASPENLTRINLNASRRLEPMSAAQLAAFLKREQEKFGAIIRSPKLEQQ